MQQQAIDELEALPLENPMRSRALELFLNLRATLAARQDIEPEERELIMRLSPLYLEKLSQATQQGVQQGIQQGIQQERRQMVENLLKARFETLDEELLAAVDSLAKFPANIKSFQLPIIAMPWE